MRLDTVSPAPPLPARPLARALLAPTCDRCVANHHGRITFRNNGFGPQRRHAILARAENGLIESNLIMGTGGAAIA